MSGYLLGDAFVCAEATARPAAAERLGRTLEMRRCVALWRQFMLSLEMFKQEGLEMLWRGQSRLSVSRMA